MGAKWRKHEASKLATAICCQTLSSVSFLSWFFGSMKGFNFSRFGKVHRQQHQEELAAQQAVMYMRQHLGSSRSGRFFSHTKSSKTSTEPLGYSKFSHVFFEMFIYIHTIHVMVAYVLFSYHPSKTRTFLFALFFGGWFVQGQPLDLSRSPNRLDNGKSSRRTSVRGTRLVVVGGIFPFNFSTMICVY